MSEGGVRVGVVVAGGRGVRIAALSGRWFIRCVRVLYVLN